MPPVCDVLIIGAGIAGSTTALCLADAGFEVLLVSPAGLSQMGNSAMAQGGIVFQAGHESPAALARDIIQAGDGENYSDAVQFLCREGPEAVEQILINRLEIPFSRSPASSSQEWDLTLEGGHSAQRILHCADYTGRAIMEGFERAVDAHPNIRALKSRVAVDVITSHHHCLLSEVRYQLPNRCLGAYVFNELSGEVETLLARFTVLATGGVGQLYLHSSNNPAALGSGIAMATRAGVHVKDAEYVQFHPTTLYQPNAPRFLITESMRGEGAVLLNSRGEAFMSRYHPRADLAPRDIVSRAIVHEMLAQGHDCVYLDPSPIRQNLKERFPTIYDHCLKSGLDITHSLIPVVPAAHYFCGGILTDSQGHTSLSGLYAVGECACTGLHGANRLASTSLLEGLVWGRAAARDIAGKLGQGVRSDKAFSAIPPWESPAGDEHNDDPALIAQDWSNIRHTMWNYVGITRSSARLQRACDELRNLSRRITDFYRRTPLSRPIIELFHGCNAAQTIAEAARRNKISKGCHYRVD